MRSEGGRSVPLFRFLEEVCLMGPWGMDRVLELVDDFMAENCGEGRSLVSVDAVTDFMLDIRNLATEVADVHNV